MSHDSHAPGRPGTEPRWTTSAKTGVGAAIDGISRVDTSKNRVIAASGGWFDAAGSFWRDRTGDLAVWWWS